MFFPLKGFFLSLPVKDLAFFFDEQYTPSFANMILGVNFNGKKR